MQRRWWTRLAKIALFIVVAAGLVGLVVMLLWNWLLPPILGVRAIDFWQALGLFALARLLVGGLRRGGHRGHWRGRMAAHWASMSDEERTRVRAAMAERCGGRHRRSGQDAGAPQA
jgi:hypothetical protein